MSKCGRCLHNHSDVDGACIERLRPNGAACDCTPELFIPFNPKEPGYRNFAYHQSVVQKMSDTEERVRYLIEAVTGARNCTNWEFITLCWHYFIGFTIGMQLDQVWFERIAKECEPETIRRCRQKVCHPELEQLKLFQEELKELEKQNKNHTSEYWQVQDQIKEFWKTAKYIPNDIALLKAKGIKESGIFEWSIEELLAIC